MMLPCHALVPLAEGEAGNQKAKMLEFISGLLDRPTTCNTVAASALGGIEILICGFDEREHFMVIFRCFSRHTYTYCDMPK